MKLLYTSLAVLAIVVSSCRPMTYVEESVQVAVTETFTDYSESTSRILDAESNLLVMPVVANLDVEKKKFVHVEREAFVDIKVTNASIANIDKYKRTALGRATKACGADILISPNIEVVTEDGRFVITVTGYPAKYKDFRNATAKDIELVKGANEANSGVNMIVNDMLKVQVNK